MAIDVAVEEVASNLEEIASATRRINTNSVSFFLGGLAVGAAAGFYFGYRWNKEKIKAEAYAESEKEVQKIRDLYSNKKALTTVETEKPPLDEVVRDAGYGDISEQYVRPLPAPVPGLVDPTPRSAPPVVTYEGGKSKDLNWNYPEELQNRTEDRPYIIHQDEFKGSESGYDQATYTFYAADEVLVDETDVNPIDDPEDLVGLENLKFGHGADDIDVVFVRNDKLELEFEICRHPGSFEEEVVGLDGNEPD